MNIGLVIPTLNAGESFAKLLKNIELQNIKISEKIIIDSGSVDDTLLLGEKYNYKIIKIEKFNHGNSRKIAVENLHKSDVVVFITQDIELYDINSIAKLTEIFQNSSIAATYGRQIPKNDANPIAKHNRFFNYPSKSAIKKFEDKNLLGIKAVFLSDSFAAYNINILRKIGNFPENVIIGEDMYIAAKMLNNGYEIYYNAEAKVYHSHNYNLMQEFKRYFDTGVFHSREKWIIKSFGKSEGEGIKIVLSQLKYLYSEKNFNYIIKAIFINFIRFLAYKLGQFEKYLPIKIKVLLSAQSYFFK